MVNLDVGLFVWFFCLVFFAWLTSNINSTAPYLKTDIHHNCNKFHWFCNKRYWKNDEMQTGVRESLIEWWGTLFLFFQHVFAVFFNICLDIYCVFSRLCLSLKSYADAETKSCWIVQQTVFKKNVKAPAPQNIHSSGPFRWEIFTLLTVCMSDVTPTSLLVSRRSLCVFTRGNMKTQILALLVLLAVSQSEFTCQLDFCLRN